MSQLISETKETHDFKRVIIVEINTGVVLFDHTFPKAWLTKSNVNIGGFLLSWNQICNSVNEGGVTKLILHAPKTSLCVDPPFSPSTLKFQEESSITHHSSFPSVTAALSTSKTHSRTPSSLSENLSDISFGSIPKRLNQTNSFQGTRRTSGESSSLSPTTDPKRLMYIVFGRDPHSTCLVAVFLEGSEKWRQLAQEFADSLATKFGDLYFIKIQSMDKLFRKIKDEAEVDVELTKQILDSFKDFTTEMETIKNEILVVDEEEIVIEMPI